MPHVSIELGDHSTAKMLFEPICQLYDEIFSAPPFHWEENESDQHRHRLTTLIANPWFGIATAFVGGELIGFAYGYRLSVSTSWWQGFLQPVPADVTTEHEGRTFAVIDLAIRQPWRRQGIGRRLLATLLNSRNEQRATLAVQPWVEESHIFYRRLGWRYVGQVRGVAGESAPYFDIYWLPLRGES